MPTDSINLLREEKNQTINEVLNWALGAGRILIILVEIIALSAFLYRFILDNQLQDLHSKIKQEQEVVLLQKDNEKKYRNLQERLSLVSSLSQKGVRTTKIYKDIIGFAPPGMTFSSLTLTGGILEIKANVNSAYPLSLFIKSLKAYPSVAAVVIDKIENKTSNGFINVGISVTLKSY